jgi:mRNA-degrading endonuclease RelE of RelBE toxin-antitoxin system
VNIEIKRSFSKDIEKILDKKILKAVSEVIDQIQQSSSIKEIDHVKKITGSKKYYRVKIGNYRMGLFVENRSVFLVRFLHRKDIYRYFP